MQRVNLSLTMVSLAMLACGNKTVDLDHGSSVVFDSTDPAVLATTNEYVLQIAVDDDRIYWLGKNARSCLKRDCAATLVTYLADGDAVGPGFEVHDGQVYWFAPEGQATALFSCPISGGAARKLVDSAPVSSANSVQLKGIFGADRVFFTDAAGAEMLPLSGTVQAPLPLGQPEWLNNNQPLAVNGDYIYWSTGNNDPYSRSLLRTRSDGSAPTETVATDLEPVGPLTFDSSYVYWSQAVLAGSIVRCPLAGCTGQPELIAAAIRSPNSLLVSDKKLYFQHEIDVGQYALSSCTLGQCDSPSLIAQVLQPSEAMAVDDQYVYVGTLAQPVTPSHDFGPDENVAVQIRRFPK